MLRALTCALLALITVAGIAPGQEPPTPVPPVPPDSATPPDYPSPTPAPRPRKLTRPATAPVPALPGQAPAPFGGGKYLLNDGMSLEKLLDEAQKATGLERDALRAP